MAKNEVKDSTIMIRKYYIKEVFQGSFINIIYKAIKLQPIPGMRHKVYIK